MNDPERLALALFATEMSAAYSRLASALGGTESRSLTRSAPPSEYGPATQALPWTERLLRQSLIIQEIINAGGSVPQQTWYEIAAKYGYKGRGLAGFFRSNGGGLLDLKNDKVRVTKNGRDRLAQNRERVDLALADA